MQQFQKELDRIKKILRSSTHGMSVTEIARMLNKNKHSVGRYLDILLMSGHVEMRMYGKAKVFSLSSRVPLDNLMGGLHDLLLIVDNDNRIVRVNDQFLQLIQKTRKDLLGRDIAYILFSEPVADTILSSIRSSLESGPKDTEVILDETNGGVFRQKIIPTVFEDGGSGTVVLLENITERKSAEQALRTSEEQFRLMADNVQDGIAIYRNWKLSYMNRRGREITGCSMDELLRLSPLDIVAPEDRDRIEQVLNHCSSTNCLPSEVTTWIVRKDGTRRFVSCRITSLQHDQETILYIVITDMTGWKLTQDALENQLIFLQHMIDTFPNPLFYIDTHGKYLGCNSAFSRLTGKNIADITGKTNAELGETWDMDLFEKFNGDLFAESGVRTYKAQFHHPDGQVSVIAIQKSTMTTIDGGVRGVVGIILAVGEPEGIDQQTGEQRTD